MHARHVECVHAVMQSIPRLAIDLVHAVATWLLHCQRKHPYQSIALAVKHIAVTPLELLWSVCVECIYIALVISSAWCSLYLPWCPPASDVQDQGSPLPLVCILCSKAAPAQVIGMDANASQIQSNAHTTKADTCIQAFKDSFACAAYRYYCQ